MAQYKVGDVLSDCPNCNSAGSVIFRGKAEGVCGKCGSIFEVSFEAGDTVEDQVPQPVAQPAQVVQQKVMIPPAPPKPVVPTARPQQIPQLQKQTQQIPQLPKQKVTEADIGKLTSIPEVVDTPMKAIKLDEN